MDVRPLENDFGLLLLMDLHRMHGVVRLLVLQEALDIDDFHALGDSITLGEGESYSQALCEAKIVLIPDGAHFTIRHNTNILLSSFSVNRRSSMELE